MRLSALLLLGVALAGLASAAETAPEARTPAELKRLQDEIAKTSGQREADEAERARAAAEAAALSEEATEAAAAIQSFERDLTRAETRMKALAAREKELADALDQRHERIGPLLGALQRLSRDPPPALAVAPDDAVAAARGAMLIASVAERLEAEARALAADLTDLARTRTALAAERDAAKTRSLALAARQGELAGLIARRQQAVADLAAGIADADGRIAQLQARAADMTDLMAWIEENPSPAAAPAAEAATGPVTVAARKARTRFAAHKGELRWPAMGRVEGRFGEPAENGARLGVTLKTRAAAQVVAPVDGEIVFAGPFEGYGGLLILSPGEDYFVVIGGLGRLDATVGQHVLAGEPLGAMAGAGGSGDPVMYIELRQDNAPIDPLPWFAPEASG